MRKGQHNKFWTKKDDKLKFERSNIGENKAQVKIKEVNPTYDTFCRHFFFCINRDISRRCYRGFLSCKITIMIDLKGEKLCQWWNNYQKYCELTAWRSFVTSLNLIVSEFDKCIVLLGQLVIQNLIVLFAQHFFSFLKHAIAYHLNL